MGGGSSLKEKTKRRKGWKGEREKKKLHMWPGCERFAKGQEEPEKRKWETGEPPGEKTI